MLKRFIKKFIATPELEDIEISQEVAMPTLYDQDSSRRERNQHAVDMANLNLQKDAYQKNLIVLNRTAMIGLFLGIVALHSKQNITLTPDIKVYEQKTTQTN